MLLISEAHEELFQLLIQWHDSVRGRLVYSFLKFSLRHSRYKGSLAVCHGSLHQPGEDASTVTCYIRRHCVTADDCYKDGSPLSLTMHANNGSHLLMEGSASQDQIRSRRFTIRG